MPLTPSEIAQAVDELPEEERTKLLEDFMRRYKVAGPIPEYNYPMPGDGPVEFVPYEFELRLVGVKPGMRTPLMRILRAKLKMTLQETKAAVDDAEKGLEPVLGECIGSWELKALVQTLEDAGGVVATKPVGEQFTGPFNTAIAR